MLEETGTKVSIATVIRVLYWRNLKGRSARKQPRLQNRHKKARLRFAGGTGAIHKIDRHYEEENYVDILKQHLKTSVRKLKHVCKWVFQMDNDPKPTFKAVAKWLNKDNKVKVLEWQSQSPDLNPIENVWAELKKCVRARRPTNLTQLHQLCQEQWYQILIERM